MPFYLVGSAERIAARLAALRAELVVSYFTVFAKDMEGMAAVVREARS